MLTLLDQLFDKRLLIRTGVNGLYGRGEVFERLCLAISRLVVQAGQDENAESLHFPPLMPRKQFEASGYFRNFPNLAGTVHCFCGDEETHRALLRAHDSGGDWAKEQSASDLVMVPAACYPVYPAISQRGPVGQTEVDPGFGTSR
jgi:hypothetical protein